MAEELDYPSRQRCAMLEEELEKQREDFFQMRRQLEKLKFERDQAAAEHEQSLIEASEKARAVEAELSLRVKALQVALEDTAQADEMSALQRQLQTGKIREQQLRAEVAEVRAAKEDARVARERAAQETRDKVGEVQAEVRARDLAALEMRRRVTHLERELAQETEAHERTAAQLLSWERENGAMRARLEARDAAEKAALRAREQERAEERESAARERGELKAALAGAAKDREELQISLAAARELAEQELARRVQAAKAEAQARLVKVEALRREEEEAAERRVEAAEAAQTTQARQAAELEKQVAVLTHQLAGGAGAGAGAGGAAGAGGGAGGAGGADGAVQLVAALRKEVADLMEERELRARHAEELAEEYKAAQHRLAQAEAAGDARARAQEGAGEAQAQLRAELETLSQNMQAERAHYQAKLRARDEAGAAWEARCGKARKEAEEMRGRAKRFRAAGKKLKEQCRARVAQLLQQVKAQDLAAARLRELLLEAQEALERQRAGATQRIFAAEKREEELRLMLLDAAGADAGAAGPAAALYAAAPARPAPTAAVHSPLGAAAGNEAARARDGARAAAGALEAGSPSTARRQLAALPRAQATRGPREDSH